MSSIKLVAAALIAATVLAAQGCGGASKSSSQAATSGGSAATTATSTSATAPNTPQLTQPALISRADPICARVTAQRVSKHIKGAQAFLTAAAEAATVEHKANEELAKLNPPASLASKWQQMLVDYRTVTSDIEQVGKAMALRRTPANIISNAEAARAQAATLARQAGFKDCSSE
jgi:hypothetical protein